MNSKSGKSVQQPSHDNDCNRTVEQMEVKEELPEETLDSSESSKGDPDISVTNDKKLKKGKAIIFENREGKKF